MRRGKDHEVLRGTEKFRDPYCSSSSLRTPPTLPPWSVRPSTSFRINPFRRILVHVDPRLHPSLLHSIPPNGVNPWINFLPSLPPSLVNQVGATRAIMPAIELCYENQPFFLTWPASLRRRVLCVCWEVCVHRAAKHSVVLRFWDSVSRCVYSFGRAYVRSRPQVYTCSCVCVCMCVCERARV